VRRPLLALLLVVIACSGQPGAAATRTPPPAPLVNARIFVAIGASETLGLGSQEPEVEAWTSVFYRTALPQSALFYNLGEVGATTAQALRDELPVALGLHPDLVTVWLNTNDLVHGVSPTEYAAQLDRLLSLLAREGVARMLVANTPVLSDLPAYRACLPDPPSGAPACAFTAGPVPAPAAPPHMPGYRPSGRRALGDIPGHHRWICARSCAATAAGFRRSAAVNLSSR